MRVDHVSRCADKGDDGRVVDFAQPERQADNDREAAHGNDCRNGREFLVSQARSKGLLCRMMIDYHFVVLVSVSDFAMTAHVALFALAEVNRLLFLDLSLL